MEHVSGYPVEIFVARNEEEARKLRDHVLGSHTPHDPKFEVLCWPGSEATLLGLKARSIFVDPNMSMDIDMNKYLSDELHILASLAPERLDSRGWWR